MPIPGDASQNREKAVEIFERYQEVNNRGHEQYMREARDLEDMYLAGGRQWRAEDRAKLESEGRPAYEVDIIKPAINAIIGYQIANRVDVSFVPRGGTSDERSAKLVSKVIRQMLDNARWRSAETMMALDGLVQRRGFIDLTMNYENNDLGELDIRVIDPLDAIPDPDASEYDPDKWLDFTETCWLTADQIEQDYGKDAADQVVAYTQEMFGAEEKFGTEHGIDRRGFDDTSARLWGYNRGFYGRKGPWRRYRIVRRQVNERVNTLVARWPTGDIRIVENAPREEIAWLLEQGIPVFKRRMRRTRLQVAAPFTMLHDAPSPYAHITAVPFFPTFRRGRTVGAVDNMVSVQVMLNKFISQYAHVVNSSANGGWQGEANSLANMDDEELRERGAETGLLLLLKEGRKPLQKIEPNKVPTGLQGMIEFAYKNAQIVSGVDENMLGVNQKDLSGVALQSFQYASQMKLAPLLDNLSLTRRMIAERVLELAQTFMGAERVMRITEEDPYGVTRHVPVTLNQRMDDGNIVNDLTIGEYDLVLSEQPAQVTFDNSQFEQMKTLREMNVPISNARLIRASNIMDKSEVAEEIEKQAGQTPAADPAAEADAALKQAQARKALADSVAKAIEAQFSAVKTAREIVLTPAVAELADSLLRSGGFQDADAPPIVPQAPAGMSVAPQEIGHENTHPLTPPNPEVGMGVGLNSTTETGTATGTTP